MSTSSRDYCPYTCPDVDGAIDEAHEDIKELVPARLHSELDGTIDLMTNAIKTHGTEKLREALRDCCNDLDEVKSELDRAQDRIRDLENEVNIMET